jgi:hypothetical protein
MHRDSQYQLTRLTGTLEHPPPWHPLNQNLRTAITSKVEDEVEEPLDIIPPDIEDDCVIVVAGEYIAGERIRVHGSLPYLARFSVNDVIRKYSQGVDGRIWMFFSQTVGLHLLYDQSGRRRQSFHLIREPFD